MLFIKLINVGAPDKEGRRVISYELNGMPREALGAGQIGRAESASRAPRPIPTDPLQLGAPIPGMVTAAQRHARQASVKGDKLATLEAMKMQTTIYAPADGVIAEVPVGVGDSVEAGDLLVRLRK